MSISGKWDWSITLDNSLFGLAFGAVTVYVIIILKYVSYSDFNKGFYSSKRSVLKWSIS